MGIEYFKLSDMRLDDVTTSVGQIPSWLWWGLAVGGICFIYWTIRK